MNISFCGQLNNWVNEADNQRGGGEIWIDNNTVQSGRAEGYASNYIRLFEDEFRGNEIVRIAFWGNLHRDNTVKPAIDRTLEAVTYFQTDHPEFCLWDVDGNATVDPFDIIAIQSNYCDTSPRCTQEQLDNYDVNDDGKVDIFDYLAVQDHFGNCFDY